MELIANLQRSFARPTGQPKAPANLLELATLLRQAQPGAEVARYSQLWARELQKIHDKQREILNPMRGTSRKIWAEQSLIYQDMIAALGLAGEQIRKKAYRALAETRQELDGLLEEFADSLQAMEDWSKSQHPRCLACGWDGQAPSCPHCQIHLLQPVRQPRPTATPLALASNHAEIFDTVVAVLQGATDLENLAPPLIELQNDFEQAVIDAKASAEIHPEMVVIAGILEEALGGLEVMGLAFDDLDAQHLEDGWHQFFVSQITLIDAIAESGNDQVQFSRD